MPWSIFEIKKLVQTSTNPNIGDPDVIESLFINCKSVTRARTLVPENKNTHQKRYQSLNTGAAITTTIKSTDKHEGICSTTIEDWRRNPANRGQLQEGW